MIITSSWAIKLQSVFSCFKLNVEYSIFNTVVVGVKRANHHIVPKNISWWSSWARNSVLSSSILEFKFEGEEFSNKVIGIARNLLDQSVLRIKGPSLSDYIVFLSSKFNYLRIPVWVVKFTPSNFNSDSFPSLNVVLNIPTVSLVRELEISVDNNIGVCSISDQFDIVNGDSPSSTSTGSLELKFIVSCFYFNPNAIWVFVVVVGNYCFDEYIVPNHIQLAFDEGQISSASILEAQSEFFRKTIVTNLRRGRFRYIWWSGIAWFSNAGWKRRGRRGSNITELRFRDYNSWWFDCWWAHNIWHISWVNLDFRGADMRRVNRWRAHLGALYIRYNTFRWLNSAWLLNTYLRVDIERGIRTCWAVSNTWLAWSSNSSTTVSSSRKSDKKDCENNFLHL